MTSGDRGPFSSPFSGMGEMPGRCREKDWASTPLGPAEGWPQSLRTMTTAVLGSALPSILLWGPGLVQIYNDAYIPILGGKHPWGLGMPTRECWPEAWEFNEPIYERVFAGETVSLENQLYRLRRHGPELPPDDVYITISYGPVRDERGEVGGVFITLLDTTAEVTARRLGEERERLLGELAVERSRLATVFQQAPSYIATLRGPDHVFEMANPPYLQLIGHRDVIGKPVREALPEMVSQGYASLLDEVYRSGRPFAGNEMRILLPRGPGAGAEERFFNFVYQPLPAADGTVSGILAHGVDVSELVLTRQRVEEQAAELEAQTEELRLQAVQLEEVQVELEVSNEELRETNTDLEAQIREVQEARRESEEAWAMLDGFFHAAPIAAAFLDPGLRYRRMNAALAAIDGVRAEDALGKTLGEVIPHLAARLEPVYAGVLETGEPVLNLELAAPRAPSLGGEGHYLTNYFPVKDAKGAVLGVGMVALDVTEQRAARRAEDEQARIIDTLHRVGHTVAAELDAQRIVQEVTDAATSLTGAQFGAFFYNVLDEKGEAYTLYTISGVPREKFSRFPMPRNTDIFAPTFHGSGVMRSDDITRDPRYGRNAPYHGMPAGHLPVTSYLAVPVISRTGEVLGGLFFGHEKPGVFEERHEQLAVGIAAWAAVALDNARLYEAEHRARNEAERANRVKSEFLATMSHELRTPLNATIGYADLMLGGIPEPVPASAQEHARRIILSARHLLGLIEEILTFSRLEAGEERMELEEVDPVALLHEARILTEPLALQKGLHFEGHAPEDAGTVVTDPRKLLQILLNLLGNAVKFTDRGRVGLSLEVVGDEVFFRVEDTGPGIAAEHREKIFDPFWQVDPARTRKAGGTGLGLSVTRRLARLMDGEVEVASEVGAGSAFTVRLPRAPGDGRDTA